ncbi:MAG: hypothetical protein WB948_09630 [Desulfobaccales bacterium]
MRTSVRRFQIYFVMAMAFFTWGCTTTFSVPNVTLQSKGSDYIADKKIDLVVNLCLTDALKDAKWEKHSMGDTWVIPIGEQLAKNARETSEIAFQRVLVSSSPVPAESKQVDVYLTPRVAVIERSVGTTGFGESIFTITMEWKMEDLNHNIIWADSITGQGKANTGNIFTYKGYAEKQMEMLLNDLFSKSLTAMRTSPEINNFASRK